MVQVSIHSVQHFWKHLVMKSSFFVARDVNTSLAANNSVACVCECNAGRRGGGGGAVGGGSMVQVSIQGITCYWGARGGASQARRHWCSKGGQHLLGCQQLCGLCVCIARVVGWEGVQGEERNADTD
jgi:hypothetical protein